MLDTGAPPPEGDRKGGKIANVKRKLDLGAPAQKLHLGPAFDRSFWEMLTECHCGPSQTEQEIKQLMSEAKQPVVLNVYTVGHNKVLQELNYVVENFLGEGGVFHGAIEVCGHEHSFGGCRQNRCGIFCSSFRFAWRSRNARIAAAFGSSRDRTTKGVCRSEFVS